MKHSPEISKLIKNYYFKPFLFFKIWWLYLLITFWTLHKKGKQIYSSLCYEKTKIIWTATIFLLIIILIHSSLKIVLWLLKPKSINKKSILVQNQIKKLAEAKKKSFSKILFYLLASCLLAPIIEESVFRYFIFKVLGKVNPISYFISYFVFTLSHWQEGENFATLFAQYSATAIGLIWIYNQSNWNLTYPIILHSLVNAMLISITLINPNFTLI